MAYDGKTVITDALLRLFVGTAASIMVGFLLYGNRVFQPGLGTFACTLVGADVALTYSIYKIPQKNLALAVSFLIAIIMASRANRNGLSHLIFLTAMPWATVFLSDGLIRWKDVRPARGKLVVLGPALAIVYAVLTCGLAVLVAYRCWLKTLAFETLLFFNIGVSLGLGFELAEYVLSILHKSRRLDRHIRVREKLSD